MSNFSSTPQATGLACPECKMFIPLTVTGLLVASGFQCPHCGLMITIDRQKSSRAMAALKKVAEAQRKVEKASRFSR